MPDKPGLDLTASPRIGRNDRDEIRKRIASGHGSMPGFARKLSADELEGLVDYVIELEGAPGGEDGEAATSPRRVKAAD